jgi:3-oxoacyl-[acyl-carrier protein] reductase
MRLSNKVAIITGAGAGIGKASASIFAREGAKVVVADINDEDGGSTVDAITAGGGNAVFVHTDVSLAADVKSLMAVTMDAFGKIDILFNNAGTGQKLMKLEETDESHWDLIHNVNLKSVFLGMKYVLPHMKKAKSGVIINTGSMSGVRPRMYSAAYVSTKAAINMLTKAVALEVAADNVRVNCINPVVTVTTMLNNLTEEERQAWAKTIPLGRIAQPEDMAYAALYLASDEASMVTGISFDVDGGRGI